MKSIQEKLNVDETSWVNILVNFDGNADKSQEEGVKIHKLLKIGGFPKDGEQNLFADGRVILSLSFELNHFQDVKLSTEKHEPIDRKMLQR